MTGDLGSDAGRARSRPHFLPPDDGLPPPEPGADAPQPPPVPSSTPRHGIGWSIALIASAGALLVSAFLPWARASVVVDLFGSTITREIETVAGIDADDVVLAVPVFAVIAIVMACWDLLARDTRITALAAVPGALSVVACLLFLLRLGDARDRLPTGGLDAGYEITLLYGWYVAVAAALLVTGFSLARPLTARLGGASRRGQAVPYPQGGYPQDPYYGQYAQDPNAQDPYAQGRHRNGHHAGAPDAAWPQQNGWEPQAATGEPRDDRWDGHRDGHRDDPQDHRQDDRREDRRHGEGTTPRTDLRKPD